MCLITHARSRGSCMCERVDIVNEGWSLLNEVAAWSRGPEILDDQWGWGVGRQRARAIPWWPPKPCSAGYELGLCSRILPCGLARITYPWIPCSSDCCPGGWHVLPLASFLTQSPPWPLGLPAPARDRSSRQSLVDIWGCCQGAGKPAGEWHLAPTGDQPDLDSSH